MAASSLQGTIRIVKYNHGHNMQIHVKIILSFSRAVDKFLTPQTEALQSPTLFINLVSAKNASISGFDNMSNLCLI